MLATRNELSNSPSHANDQYSIEAIKALFKSDQFGEKFCLSYHLAMISEANESKSGSLKSENKYHRFIDAAPNKLVAILFAINENISTFQKNAVNKNKLAMKLEIQIMNNRTNEGVSYIFTDLKTWGDFTLNLIQQATAFLEIKTNAQKQIEMKDDSNDEKVNIDSGKDKKPKNGFPFWLDRSNPPSKPQDTIHTSTKKRKLRSDDSNDSTVKRSHCKRAI